MNHTEIVKKLIGPVTPQGDASLDHERYENLKAMCELVDNLLRNIEDVAVSNKDAKEFTVKRAGEYATKFLKENGINVE